MHALYRKPFALHSLILALLLSACGDQAPPPPQAPVSNVYLDALQEAEALKHSIEEQNREQQRMHELLGKDQTPAR